MADKFMYIPDNEKQTYPFCGLKLVVETFELNESTNQNSKILQVVKPC